jgi:hypothetical protein
MNYRKDDYEKLVAMFDSSCHPEIIVRKKIMDEECSDLSSE